MRRRGEGRAAWAHPRAAVVRPGAAGFTLTELLVVVGIVAVLVALMVGTTSVVRARANTVTCASNLRQVHAAFLQYAGDSGGYLPRAVVPPMTDFINWAHLVQKYVAPGDFETWQWIGRVGVLQCPSHPSTGMVMETGYTMNAFVGGREAGESRTVKLVVQGAVRNAAEVVYLADVSDSLRWVYVWPYGRIDFRWSEHPDRDPHTGLQVLHYQHNLPGGVQERVARDRHGRGRINALYMDGHVATVRSGDLTMRDFDDGVRGNRRVVGWDR